MASKIKRQYENLAAPKGNYIKGQFIQSKDVVGKITIVSPADSADKLGDYNYSFQDVDFAVEAAKTAFETWRFTSLPERIQYLQKYKEALKKMEGRLAEVIAREVGKPLWEAKQEVTTMMNKVDVTIQEGLVPVQDKIIPSILPDTTGVCHYKPHGVFVVIGPFNFPGHLANGHFVPALLTGNTVIFKPSEKSPATGQLIAEAFHEAGIPAGVFNLVQGEKEVGRRLCTHEGINGVLFTGSYDVGLKIKQDTIQQYWKLLALEMGGKNSTVVCNDAHIDSAIYETITSSFLTTGQRCSATSRIMVHKSIFEKFVETFHARSKKFSIGHPLDNPFMGPLIDTHAVDKYLKFIGIGARENCDIIMRGKQFETDFDGHYVTPSIFVVKDNTLNSVKKSVFQQSEIFGPCVVIYSFDEDEEAIRLANATQFGLAASVFSGSKERFQYYADRLEFGVINWNRSTVGASSRLPFGGVKRSGNHFPTAISAASAYCTYPVATLEVAEPKIPATPSPGLNW